jgi:hypothetical protein
LPGRRTRKLRRSAPTRHFRSSRNANRLSRSASGNGSRSMSSSRRPSGRRCGLVSRAAELGMLAGDISEAESGLVARCRSGTIRTRCTSRKRLTCLRTTRPSPIELESNSSLTPQNRAGGTARFRHYAEAASRLCSVTADCEPATGLRTGGTSACAGARRSILPITGRSCVPAVDNDTNLFSLHKRSISRRSHGCSTCCGKEKKFRNVQIRYARCKKFGCTYRGPIGVSTSRTPSASFSIHIDYHLGRRPIPPLL